MRDTVVGVRVSLGTYGTALNLCLEVPSVFTRVHVRLSGLVSALVCVTVGVSVSVHTIRAAGNLRASHRPVVDCCINRLK
jgi:hypothetical protein